MKREQYEIVPIEFIKNIVQNTFNKHLEIELAYLYGSYSKELQNIYSDIDIGIILKKKYDLSHKYVLKLAVELDEFMLEKFKKRASFEVRVLNEATPRFLKQVVLDGKNIYYVDKNFKDEYEIRVLREYLDFKPYLEKMDKKYLTGILDGKN